MSDASRHHDALPDRGHLLTEQRLAASAELDALATADVLRVINTQDATIPAVVAAAIPAIAALVDDLAARMERGGRLIYIGAGTSGRLGVLDASECPPTFFSDPGQVMGIIAGGDAALRRSSEGREDEPDGAHAELNAIKLSSDDVLVGIAAGGTTPYVLGALEYAKERGATTALLTCVAADQISAATRDAVDHLIALPVGPEVVTGSTRMKAGTATKLALNMISTAAMVRLGKVWGHLMVDVRATNAKLRDRAARMLMQTCDLDRDAALRLLDEADGRVKTAIVMARRGVACDEAERLLDEHHGRLRAVVGDPPD